MRTLVALLVLVVASPHALAGPDDDTRRRDRIFRMLTLADELRLDDVTTAKLYPVLSSYEQEREKLLDEYRSIIGRLHGATDPAVADKLLDDSLATQRALIAAEAQFVVKLRQVLPVELAARVRVTLSSTTRSPAADTRRASYDREALFPPGSPLTGRCDPFAQMHRCPG